MADSSGINWDDPMFNSAPFEDALAADFNDFTNLYVEDAYQSARVMQSGPLPATVIGYTHTNTHPFLSGSTEDSSPDSGSETSSRRKRKVTSESPVSDPAAEQPCGKKEEISRGISGSHTIHHFDQNFTQPMNDLSLERDHATNSPFAFASPSSSPSRDRDYHSTASLNARVHPLSTAGPGQFSQSPVHTINPGMFQIGPGDESPVMPNMFYSNNTSIATYPTSPTEPHENRQQTASWSNSTSQITGWSEKYDAQHHRSDDNSEPSPSPDFEGLTPVAPSSPARTYLPLHIAPISTKSRVETQINIIMTLERSIPGVEYLHLPLHTIAKSKLLAKEHHDQAKSLQLHVMLVCTSAMNQPLLRQKALRRAALQSNRETQLRAERLREVPDEDKNSMADIEDAERPVNGGEVRICSNCIQRERKRAGRKKLKKEEEQQHWERYETERVVVFNSNEYLPFKQCDKTGAKSQENDASLEDGHYEPPDGAMQVSAAMRIACYCRHQGEKEGFRVIFTLKDQEGKVVAQQMSDSILITDDHKTHPTGFPTSLANETFYQPQTFASGVLPTSYSMVDLSSQVHTFPSSRSTGHLPALGYGQQHFNTQSHIHQVDPTAFVQRTSTAVTPTSLSRPASPNSASQSGPNKKRKSGTFHRRVPSGLTMTPRIDGQTISNSMITTVPTVAGSFSPTNANVYGGHADQTFATISSNATPAHRFGSGPSTPAAENVSFFQTIPMDMARSQNTAAYFSHPSSAVPSRANSPVLQSNHLNLSSYSRQSGMASGSSTHSRHPGFSNHGASSGAPQDHERTSPPTITKITPCEGPVSGGTEVSIYGYNFTNGTQVMFGEQLATTVFYGPQALLATSPPSRAGAVSVTLVLPSNPTVPYTNPTNNRQLFTYTDTNPRIMEMALRFLSQQQTGSTMPWNQFANQVATKYIQSGMESASTSKSS